MAQNRPRRALAVLAHPDDAEFLIGGTFLHLKDAGWELGVITMTAGDCGSVEYTKEEIARVRYAEGQAAARELGASYECAGLPDVEVFSNAETVLGAVELMRRFEPDVVITHSPIDYHVDHEETSRIARSAAFALAAPLVQTRHVPPAPPVKRTPALYYADPAEGIDWFGDRIQPHFYVDITGQIERKKAALSRHQSQIKWVVAHHQTSGLVEQMLEWAAFYGSECGVPWAEGLRQHLGHGYPREPVLQEALAPHLRSRVQQER